MTIKLDNPSGPAPVRHERREAHARQDQWMAQLERAMFSSGPDNSLRQEPQSSLATAAQAGPHPAALARSQAPEQAPHLDHGAHAEDGASAATARAPVHPGGARAEDHGERAGIQAATDGALVAGGATPPAAGMLSGRPASNDASAVPGVLAVPPLRLGAHLPPMARRAALPEAPDSQHSAAAGDGRQFDKRALHLHIGADGVHAWLRDADLHHGQMNAVMQALAAEVALTGRQLTALTVNGRPFVASATLPEGSDVYSNAADSAPAPTSLFHPVIKGNPAP